MFSVNTKIYVSMTLTAIFYFTRKNILLIIHYYANNTLYPMISSISPRLRKRHTCANDYRV